jgi:hypothetical protein
MVIQRLRPGALHGRVTKSLRVADFILTEAAFTPHSTFPRHAHETRISALRCGETHRTIQE